MGTSFGRYKVAEEIGRGAMGVVYRAVDPSIGRSVAIKAINRAYLESVGVQPGQYGERFQREAQVAGALNHPHIVKIFDLGADYLVMEYVEGQTLAALLRARGRLPREQALRVLGEAASALDHAHQSGVVHRDIKPANVMVQPDGSVKVMDFGLARIESSTLTAAGEVLGSAAYMAPEVVLGQPADARSDIFSLAVVAYELLTGVRPFAGPTVSAIIQSVVRTTPRPVRDLDATLQPEVDAVFTRALAKEPEVRFTTAGDFAQALSRAVWSQGGEAGAPLGALVDTGDAGDVGESTVILETASTIRMPEPEPAAGESTTILSVEADELSETAEVVAPAVVPPAQTAGREADVTATVILQAPPAAAPEPQAAPEPAEATAILQRPAVPAPSTPPRPLAADATVRIDAPSPDSTARLPVLPTTSAPADDATLRLGGPAVPVAGPHDATAIAPPPVTSRGPVTPPPAPADSSATVTISAAEAVAARQAAEARPAAPPSVAPPTPPLPLPLPVTKAAPRTPPVPAAASKPAAPAPAPTKPVASPPAAKKGSGALVAGLVVVILVLFAAAAGGFWWLVRSRNTAAVPEATPVPVADATPAPVDEPPATEATPEAPPAEATPEPADSAPADVPQPARLTIESEPAGATVSVGRRRRGVTPLTVSLPAGAAAVTVEKDGFKPWRESPRLKAGEARTLRARLEPLPTPRPAAATAPTPAPKPAVREGDLVTLGPDVTPPRKLSGSSPNLPDKLRRNLTGSVVVAFIVEIDGSVSGARVVESLNLAVDKAALDAVAKWKYEPARSHNVKVRMEQRAKFTFVSQ